MKSPKKFKHADCGGEIKVKDGIATCLKCKVEMIMMKGKHNGKKEKEN